MVDASSLKEEGNARFKDGDFSAAVDAYTRSLELDASQHLCYSNRSAAYLKLGNRLEEALADANRCVELAPQWAKGYSRQAAALQELKRWDEAVAACEKGLAAGPDAALKKMIAEVQSRRFQERIQGSWHGTVSEALGGYEQEMEFAGESEVRVEVLGRSISGRYWVDASAEPHRITIQVPMQDMNGSIPPGMPVPPPVPYIARLDEAGLHMCCPYMRMEIPTAFEGPGYCLMKKGALAQSEDSEISNLSRDEKFLRCTQELIAALPDVRLEEVTQNDSEEETRDKLMIQVKLESSMFMVQKRYSEEVMKEILAAANQGKPVPPALEGTAELAELKRKLRICGILEQEAPSRAPAPAAPSAPAAPAAAPAPKAEKDLANPIPSGDNLSLSTIGIVAFGAIAVAGALLWWQRKKRQS